MAEAAAGRDVVRHAEAVTSEQARLEERMREADPAVLRTYRGPCDVCGQEIEGTLVAGTHDYGIGDDGRLYTWLRHIGGPLEPDCGRYSSRVDEVTHESPAQPEG